MKSRSYFFTAIITLFLLLGSVAALNWIADPLDIYRIVRADGFNAYKSKVGSYSRLAKPLMMEQNEYQRLAFGSSRTEMGIPVYGTAWDQVGDKGLNAAVSSADITTINTLFHHALKTTDMKDAVIGLDFFMFNGNSQVDYEYPQVIYDAATETRLLRRLQSYQLTLLNSDITEASFYTLKKQKDPKYDRYLETGQVNIAWGIKESVEDGYQNFPHFEEPFMRSSWTSCKDNLYSYDNGKVNTLERFEYLLNSAVENQVSLNLYIPPVHARLLEALDAIGLWSSYEQWKRDLVAIVDKTTKRHSNVQIKLWDFSGYSPYSTEAIPLNSGVSMRWYLDASHFTDVLGGMMLNQMYGEVGGGGFGKVITVDNIESHLENIRDKQQDFRVKTQYMYSVFLEQAAESLEFKRSNGKICSGLPSVKRPSV